MDDVDALAVLSELACRPVEPAGLTDFLARVVDVAVDIAQADSCCVQVLDPSTRRLRIAAEKGTPAWWATFWDGEGQGHGAGPCALATRQRVLVADVEESGMLAGKPSLAVLQRAGVRAVHATPLMSRAGATVGVLSTHSRRTGVPDDHALRWIDVLARQTADAIDAAQVRGVPPSSGCDALVRASADAVFTMAPDWSNLRAISGQALAPSTPDDRHWLERYVDRLDHPRFLDAVHKAVRDAGLLDIQHRVRCPDGSVRWVHSRAVPVLDAHEHIAEWQGMTHAMQPPCESPGGGAQDRQQRVLDLLAALPIGVEFASTRDGVNVIRNGALRHLLGQAAGHDPSAAARGGDGNGEALHFSQDGRALRPDELPLHRAATTGKCVEPTELRLRRRDGVDVALQVLAAPVVDPRGVVTGAVSVMMARDAWQGAAEVASQLRRRDEFMAAVGHELRNPLAALSHAVELVKEVPDSERPAMEALIRSQIDVLRRLVDDLLDMSRLSLDGIRLRKAPVSLRKLLEGAALATASQREPRGQSLTLDVPWPDIVFEADEIRLQQVLANLLDNASKYGGARARVTLAAEAQGSDIVIRCRDDGPGIAGEVAATIFEPLTRTDDARRAAPGGLGLGLFLVKRIAVLHGGAVRLISDGPGAGTCFEVRYRTSRRKWRDRAKRRTQGAMSPSPPQDCRWPSSTTTRTSRRRWRPRSRSPATAPSATPTAGPRSTA